MSLALATDPGPRRCLKSHVAALAKINSGSLAFVVTQVSGCVALITALGACTLNAVREPGLCKNRVFRD